MELIEKERVRWTARTNQTPATSINKLSENINDYSDLLSHTHTHTLTLSNVYMYIFSRTYT